jgi:hypothetical protein
MTVYTSLIGGLGNQMFQYAAGRALALRKNTELNLDVSGFESYGLHQGFELQRVFFACTAEIASTSDINRLLGWQSGTFIRRFMKRPAFAAFRPDAFVVEPYFHYWPGIDKVPQDCCLVGYWQSERYFADAVPQIRADFAFRLPLENQNAELAKHIDQVNAVSLHVRRGDFVNNPKTSAKHGLCSLDYYRAAIQHVAERVQQPHFFIFSDDMAWVQENLKIDFPCIYVQHNCGAESYNDMHLMSLCRHHIIANSSFSWWGAWLNLNMEKIVVAPQKWFAKEADVQDLFSTGWVTL